MLPRAFDGNRLLNQSTLASYELRASYTFITGKVSFTVVLLRFLHSTCISVFLFLSKCLYWKVNLYTH